MSAPTVIALHSISGAHPAWSWLAAQLPEVRVIAPDLRGRGLSAELPPPYGIDQHVQDVLAVMDALELEEVVLVGHSLGAFIAVAVAAARPEAVSHAVLVDGGLPLTVALTLHPDDLVELVCGRPVSRVDFAFSSGESHRQFWRMHPALAAEWSPNSDRYADYLVEERVAADGSLEFRPIALAEAVAADERELSGSVSILRRLHEAGCPLTLLTAPRDLSNQVPGVYSARELAISVTEFENLHVAEVERVNHYTIVASDRGAKAIAREVRRVREQASGRLEAG